METFEKLGRPETTAHTKLSGRKSMRPNMRKLLPEAKEKYHAEQTGKNHLAEKQTWLQSLDAPPESSQSLGWNCQGQFRKKCLHLAKRQKCKCNNLSLANVFAQGVNGFVCNFAINLAPDRMDTEIIPHTAITRKYEQK